MDSEPSTRRVPRKSPTLEEMLRQLSPDAWTIMFALVGRKDHDLLLKIQAAVSRMGRREQDDSRELRQIAERRRSSPELSIPAAAAQVVAALERVGTTRSGTEMVRLGNRTVSLPGAQKHLENKYRKHEQELLVQLDDQERGRMLVRRLRSSERDALGPPAEREARPEGPSPEPARIVRIPQGQPGEAWGVGFTRAKIEGFVQECRKDSPPPPERQGPAQVRLRPVLPLPKARRLERPSDRASDPRVASIAAQLAETPSDSALSQHFCHQGPFWVRRGL